MAQECLSTSPPSISPTPVGFQIDAYGSAQPVDAPRGTHTPYLTLLCLGTIALAPYVLARRRLVSLQTEVAALRIEREETLRRNMRWRALLASAQRTEHRKVIALLEETKSCVEKLREETEDDRSTRADAEARVQGELRGMRRMLERLEADGMQRDHMRAEWEKLRRNDLRHLLQDNQLIRAHLGAVKNVGASLADVAAFMHEVELQQGYTPRKDDGRGIERMRQVAKRLQEIPDVEAGVRPDDRKRSDTEVKH